MVGNHEASKNAIIENFDSYSVLMEKIGYSTSDDAKRMIKNIKKNKFIVLVAGEAKSGKSTFINAFLGEEILPMDVKQCTSSIIELSYGEYPKLIATYGDGRKGEEILCVDEIKKFLKEGALDDEYRDIPAVLINNELLIIKKGNISEQEIEEFYKKCEKENLHGLSPEEYREKIHSYINEKKDKWQNIVINFKIEWPFKENYKSITVVDSPGVHAIGGVAGVTENYIKKANAILFVKSLRGQAMESISFREFLNERAVSKHKEAIFLVLSGKADLSPSDLNKLLDEAKKIYGNIQDDKRIEIDSKIEMILNKCKNKSEEEIDEYFEESEKDETLFPPAENAWLKSKGNIKEFEKKMKESSNFEKLEDSLETLSENSGRIAVDVLKKLLISEYERVKGDLEEKIGLYKTKLVDPDKLELDIKNKKSELENIVAKMTIGIEKIQKDYLNNDGKIDEKIENELANYQNEIEEMEKKFPTFKLKHLQEISFEKIEEMDELKNEIQKEIITICNSKLIEITQKELNTFIPNIKIEFSEEEFEDLERSSRSEASEQYEKIEKGVTFDNVKLEWRHNCDKHYEILKKNIGERIYDIKNTIATFLKDSTDAVLSKYLSKLSENKAKKENEYENLLQEKLTYEENQQKISSLEGNWEEVEKALKKMEVR